MDPIPVSGHPLFVLEPTTLRPWTARRDEQQMLEAIRFFVFGYVLMPEHVHLLLTEPTEHSLATSLSVLKGEISKVLKSGSHPFWQARYYDFNVFTQVKFVEKLRYIHRNPVISGVGGKTKGLAVEHLPSLGTRRDGTD